LVLAFRLIISLLPGAQVVVVEVVVVEVRVAIEHPQELLVVVHLLNLNLPLHLTPLTQLQ
jgi:hypothetical protein